MGDALKKLESKGIKLHKALQSAMSSLSQFKRLKNKNLEIANLRKYIEEKLQKMLRRNITRTKFAERFRNIIDEYNAGGSQNDDFYEKLLKLMEELRTEEERHIKERITEYNFNMLSQKYQMEQLELDEKIQKLKAALSESKQSVEDARKWIEIVKQYSEPTELTAELLNNMINKIVVHEAVKYDNGFREQKIEIYYRFVGKID